MRVLVLSMMAFQLASIAKHPAVLDETPSCAPLPTVSAVGVARPSAHGQATTMTAMAGSSACCLAAVSGEPAGTRKNHTQKATGAMMRMAGTNTAAILSAMRCTGAFRALRVLTAARTMRRQSRESAPTRTALTRAPGRVEVPPVTSSPARLATGSVSPVSMDSSTSGRAFHHDAVDGHLLARTHEDDVADHDGGQGNSAHRRHGPREPWAVRGSHERLDGLVRGALARVSRIFPRSTKVMSMAQVSKYGMPLLMATAA